MRLRLFHAVAALCLPASLGAAERAERPNVVILCDDMGCALDKQS